MRTAARGAWPHGRLSEAHRHARGRRAGTGPPEQNAVVESPARPDGRRVGRAGPNGQSRPIVLGPWSGGRRGRGAADDLKVKDADGGGPERGHGVVGWRPRVTERRWHRLVPASGGRSLVSLGGVFVAGFGRSLWPAGGGARRCRSLTSPDPVQGRPADGAGTGTAAKSSGKRVAAGP